MKLNHIYHFGDLQQIDEYKNGKKFNGDDSKIMPALISYFIFEKESIYNRLVFITIEFYESKLKEVETNFDEFGITDQEHYKHIIR